MKEIQGYLIDPEKQTIDPVKYNGDYKEIYKLIECGTFTIVRIDDENMIFVDDEGLLNNPRHFFCLRGYPQPLAGKGLLMGSNEDGDTVSSTMDLDKVKDLIVGFQELSVQGFVTKEEDNVEIMPGVKGFRITNTPVFGPAEPKKDE